MIYDLYRTLQSEVNNHVASFHWHPRCASMYLTLPTSSTASHYFHPTTLSPPDVMFFLNFRAAGDNDVEHYDVCWRQRQQRRMSPSFRWPRYRRLRGYTSVLFLLCIQFGRFRVSHRFAASASLESSRYVPCQIYASIRIPREGAFPGGDILMILHAVVVYPLNSNSVVSGEEVETGGWEVIICALFPRRLGQVAFFLAQAEWVSSASMILEK